MAEINYAASCREAADAADRGVRACQGLAKAIQAAHEALTALLKARKGRAHG